MDNRVVFRNSLHISRTLITQYVQVWIWDPAPILTGIPMPLRLCYTYTCSCSIVCWIFNECPRNSGTLEHFIVASLVHIKLDAPDFSCFLGHFIYPCLVHIKPNAPEFSGFPGYCIYPCLVHITPNAPEFSGFHIANFVTFIEINYNSVIYGPLWTFLGSF
jgi:hypothetical protein